MYKGKRRGQKVRVEVDEKEIENVKMYNESEKTRYTWNWPQGAEQAVVDGKLFTLQEYKQLGGYVLHKTIIDHTIAERFTLFPGAYISYEVTFTSQKNVPKGVISYKRSETGITYFIDEPIEAGVPFTRVIRINKNEFLKIFVSETKLYTLR
jgi:hypothetical protein